MGRKPTVNLNLPRGMRARKQRSGTVYYYYDTGEKPRREIPLGSDYPLAVMKWAELEQAKVPTASRPTFRDAWERYLQEVLPGKAPRSQQNNLREAKFLLRFFCEPEPAPLDEIEAQHIRKYMTWRSGSPVAANREKALLSHIWNCARGWGYTNQPNPCAGIRGNSEVGRKIYVEDDVFQAVYEAGDQALRDAMDLAYLIGQRPADTLKLSDHNIRDGFIYLDQNKTGTKLRVSVEGGLAELLARINRRKQTFKVRPLKLIIKDDGKPLTKGGLRGRFEDARRDAALKFPRLATEIAAFQFRDLRAKAGTDKADASGDIRQAQKQLGHSSVSMTEQYIRNRRGDKVGPTK